jgi:hypothetical protein
MLVVAAPGCSHQSRRDPRSAIDTYLEALASHDGHTLHLLTTCDLSNADILGGNVLGLGPVQRISVRTLDSLESEAASDLRDGEAARKGATEETVDSLWQEARALERRETLYSNAHDAVQRAAPGQDVDSVDVCKARVRIRWGGPRVGPEPVDREHVVRLLAARGCRWIVFSAFLRQDDPPGEPI